MGHVPVHLIKFHTFTPCIIRGLCKDTLKWSLVTRVKRVVPLLRTIGMRNWIHRHFDVMKKKTLSIVLRVWAEGGVCYSPARLPLVRNLTNLIPLNERRNGHHRMLNSFFKVFRGMEIPWQYHERCVDDGLNIQTKMKAPPHLQFHEFKI